MANENVSAVSSVLSENVHIFIKGGWERNFSEKQQQYYLHKKNEGSVWENLLDKSKVPTEKNALPSYNESKIISNTKDTRLAAKKHKLSVV